MKPVMKDAQDRRDRLFLDAQRKDEEAKLIKRFLSGELLDPCVQGLFQSQEPPWNIPTDQTAEAEDDTKIYSFYTPEYLESQHKAILRAVDLSQKAQKTLDFAKEMMYFQREASVLRSNQAPMSPISASSLDLKYLMQEARRRKAQETTVGIMANTFSSNLQTYEHGKNPVIMDPAELEEIKRVQDEDMRDLEDVIARTTEEVLKIAKIEKIVGRCSCETKKRLQEAILLAREDERRNVWEDVERICVQRVGERMIEFQKLLVLLYQQNVDKDRQITDLKFSNDALTQKCDKARQQVNELRSKVQNMKAFDYEGLMDKISWLEKERDALYAQLSVRAAEKERSEARAHEQLMDHVRKLRKEKKKSQTLEIYAQRIEKKDMKFCDIDAAKLKTKPKGLQALASDAAPRVIAGPTCSQGVMAFVTTASKGTDTSDISGGGESKAKPVLIPPLEKVDISPLLNLDRAVASRWDSELCMELRQAVRGLVEVSVGGAVRCEEIREKLVTGLFTTYNGSEPGDGKVVSVNSQSAIPRTVLKTVSEIHNNAIKSLKAEHKALIENVVKSVVKIRHSLIQTLKGSDIQSVIAALKSNPEADKPLPAEVSDLVMEKFINEMGVQTDAEATPKPTAATRKTNTSMVAAKPPTLSKPEPSQQQQQPAKKDDKKGKEKEPATSAVVPPPAENAAFLESLADLHRQMERITYNLRDALQMDSNGDVAFIEPKSPEAWSKLLSEVSDAALNLTYKASETIMTLQNNVDSLVQSLSLNHHIPLSVESGFQTDHSGPLQLSTGKTMSRSDDEEGSDDGDTNMYVDYKEESTKNLESSSKKKNSTTEEKEKDPKKPRRGKSIAKITPEDPSPKRRTTIRAASKIPKEPSSAKKKRKTFAKETSVGSEARAPTVRKVEAGVKTAEIAVGEDYEMGYNWWSEPSSEEYDDEEDEESESDQSSVISEADKETQVEKLRKRKTRKEIVAEVEAEIREEPEMSEEQMRFEAINEVRNMLRDERRDAERDKERDFYRDAERDKERDETRDEERDAERDKIRDARRDMQRDRDRDVERDESRDAERDLSRDKDRDENRDQERDEPRDKNRDEVRDEERDAERDRKRDRDRDAARDGARDLARDKAFMDNLSKDRDNKRDQVRDAVRDRERDAKRDNNRDVQRDQDRDTLRDIERDEQRDAKRDAERDNARDKARDEKRDKKRDAQRDTTRDKNRDAERDGARDLERDTARDNARDAERDRDRDGQRDRERDRKRDIERDEIRDSGRDRERDQQRDVDRDKSRDANRDETRDTKRDDIRDESRDRARDLARDKDRDTKRDRPRDIQRDRERDSARDMMRDATRDMDRDRMRDQVTSVSHTLKAGRDAKSTAKVLKDISDEKAAQSPPPPPPPPKEEKIVMNYYEFSKKADDKTKSEDDIRRTLTQSIGEAVASMHRRLIVLLTELRRMLGVHDVELLHIDEGEKRFIPDPRTVVKADSLMINAFIELMDQNSGLTRMKVATTLKRFSCAVKLQNLKDKQKELLKSKEFTFSPQALSFMSRMQSQLRQRMDTLNVLRQKIKQEQRAMLADFVMPSNPMQYYYCYAQPVDAVEAKPVAILGSPQYIDRRAVYPEPPHVVDPRIKTQQVLSASPTSLPNLREELRQHGRLPSSFAGTIGSHSAGMIGGMKGGKRTLGSPARKVLEKMRQTVEESQPSRVERRSSPVEAMVSKHRTYVVTMANHNDFLNSRLEGIGVRKSSM
eukprot:PhF_6_TR9994/c2_g1_i1/m.15193